jgi:hypothetical protein
LFFWLVRLADGFFINLAPASCQEYYHLIEFIT